MSLSREQICALVQSDSPHAANQLPLHEARIRYIARPDLSSRRRVGTMRNKETNGGNASWGGKPRRAIRRGHYFNEQLNLALMLAPAD